MRVHDRRIELVGCRLARLRDHHVADERKPVDAGIERTESVRELLRKHRHDACREINGCAAQLGVPIEGGARTHVVTDVGDGDKETPARIGLLAVDGVVEVARIFAVDRDERDVRQIDAVQKTPPVDRIRELHGLRPRLGAELDGNAVHGGGDRHFAQGVVQAPHRSAEDALHPYPIFDAAAPRVVPSEQSPLEVPRKRERLLGKLKLNRVGGKIRPFGNRCGRHLNGKGSKGRNRLKFNRRPAPRLLDDAAYPTGLAAANEASRTPAALGVGTPQLDPVAGEKVAERRKIDLLPRTILRVDPHALHASCALHDADRGLPVRMFENVRRTPRHEPFGVKQLHRRIRNSAVNRQILFNAALRRLVANVAELGLNERLGFGKDPARGFEDLVLIHERNLIGFSRFCFFRHSFHLKEARTAQPSAPSS